MPTVRPIQALALLALAAGCAKQTGSQPPGKTTFTFNNHARVPADATSAKRASPPDVCATFNIQPMSLDSTGKPTSAGAAATIVETATTGNTATIEGCIDSTSSGNDWAYLVTATDFVDCATGAAIDGVSPATVAGYYPFDCEAGLDVPVDIEIDVSIATPNAGGYVDISATVNATEVEVGCKQADFDGNVLHFGESWQSTAGDTAPDGLWGLASSGPAPQQWAGQVTAAGSMLQYYTGQFELDAPGQAAIVQTLMPASCDNAYVAADQPICTTTATATLGLNGEANPAPTASTTAGLADALAVYPGSGWAAASIQPGGASVLISGTATTTPIPASATPTQNSPADQDALTATLTNFADPSVAQFTGIWPELDQLGFVFTFVDGSGDFEWGELNPTGSGWAISGEYPLASTSPDLLACVGVFGSKGGCVKPNDCASEWGTQVDPVKPRVFHAAIKPETVAPLDPKTLAPTYAGQLEMPDGMGGLNVSPLTFDATGAAEMDCSAAVALGLTKGQVRVSVDTIAAGNAVLGALPERVLPYDCATGSAASATLALPLIATAADGTMQSATLEPKGAELGLAQSKVTCAADADGSSTDQNSTSSLAWSSEKFASAAACVLRVRTCTDGSGNALDCGTLGLTDTETVDAANRRLSLNSSARFAPASSAKVETYAAPISAEQQQSAFSIRYDAPFLSESRGAADSTCGASGSQLNRANALVTGNLASGTFAYSTLIDDSGQARLELVANPVFDCGETPATPPFNTKIEQALDDGSGGVATDICVDAQSPDTVYLTTLGLAHEPGDPRPTRVSKLTLDLTGANAPAVAGQNTADIQAAAQQCSADRLSGAAAAPRIALATMGNPVTPPPAPVEQIGCSASGDDCFCDGGWYGHVEVRWFCLVCKIDGNIALGW